MMSSSNHLNLQLAVLGVFAFTTICTPVELDLLALVAHYIYYSRAEGDK